MAGRDELVIKVRADASGVQSGIAPAIKSLDTLDQSADKASKELTELDKMKVDPTITLSLNQQAIAKARAEIARLQDQMREDILMGADTKEAQKRIAELKRSIKALDDEKVKVKVDTSNVDKASGDMAGFGSMLTKLRGGPIAAVAAGAALVGGSFIKMGADAETAALQMRSVVRDGGNVAKLLAELRRYGATSPFEFPELQQSAKMLLSFGIASNDVIKVIQNLGEVAAATGVPIEELSQIYGKMIAKGKVSTEEVMQLAERGVPVYEAFGKVLGVSADEAQRLVENGKLGRAEAKKLDDVLAQMFAGSTARQAETLNGKLSTMGDAFGELAKTIGEDLLPATKGVVSGITAMLEKSKEAYEWWNSNDPEDTPWWKAIINPPPATLDGHEFEWADIFNKRGPGGTSMDRADDARRAEEERIAAEKKAASEAARKAANLADKGPPPVVIEQWEEYGDAIEGARTELDEIIEGLDAVNNRFMDSREAMSDYQDNLSDLHESLSKYGANINLATEEGRENDEQIRATAESIGALTTARLRDMEKSGESSTEIFADYEHQRRGLVLLLTQYGMDEAAAKKYVDQLLLTPEEIKTKAVLTGVEDAETELEKLTRSRTAEIYLKFNVTEYQKTKLAQDLAQSIADNAVTRSSVDSSGGGATAGTLPAGTLIVRPRVYIDGEPIRSTARKAAYDQSAELSSATSRRRL
jgi:tape measure domain-containing protein